jgi:hypothetical protein
MKKLIVIAFIGLAAFAACNQNPENGGEEIRGNEQRSDSSMNISKYPDEGDSGSNSRLDNGNDRSSKTTATPAEPDSKSNNGDTVKTSR